MKSAKKLPAAFKQSEAIRSGGDRCIYGLAVGHLYEVSVNASPTSAITYASV
jgi:hypothetical protein